MNSLQANPEEDRGDEADDGRGYEGRGLLARRGQVCVRRLQPTGAAECQQGSTQGTFFMLQYDDYESKMTSKEFL